MGIRAFIQRHSLWTYFVLAFGIAWGGIVLAVGPSAIREGARGESVVSSGIGGQAALVFLAMLAGPTLAALLTTALVDGMAGLRELWSRVTRWNVGLRWYAVGLLTTPMSVLVVLLPLMLVSPAFTPGLFTPNRMATVVVGLIVGGLAAGFFEELGWTGFALPRVLRGRNALLVAIGFGVIHMVWHGLGDYWGSVNTFDGLYPLHFLQWVAALVGLRLLIVRIYQHTESVLLAQLTHASSTGSQLVLGPVALSALDEMLWYTLFVAALWIALGVLAMVDRPRMARRPLEMRTA